MRSNVFPCAGLLSRWQPRPASCWASSSGKSRSAIPGGNNPCPTRMSWVGRYSFGSSTLRPITVQLVVEVRDEELRVGLRGLWRARRVPLGDIQSVETVTFDPLRDYGGYGVRSSRQGTTHIAGGTRGVRLRLAKGATLVIGSQRAEELAGILSSSAKRAHRSRS